MIVSVVWLNVLIECYVLKECDVWRVGLFEIIWISDESLFVSKSSFSVSVLMNVLDFIYPEVFFILGF